MTNHKTLKAALKEMKDAGYLNGSTVEEAKSKKLVEVPPRIFFQAADTERNYLGGAIKTAQICLLPNKSYNCEF